MANLKWMLALVAALVGLSLLARPSTPACCEPHRQTNGRDIEVVFCPRSGPDVGYLPVRPPVLPFPLDPELE